jgi:hypothetical protein
MSITNRTLAALSLAALMAGAMPLIAQAKGPEDRPMGAMGPMREEMLAKYDANKDGKLDDAERAAIRADHFKKLDSNGDGKVTKAEFPAAMEAMREQQRKEHEQAMFDKMDANKDGVVTEAEFAAFKPMRDGDHHPRGDHRRGDKRDDK